MNKVKILIIVLIILRLTNVLAENSQDYSQFIAQQKANETNIVAPYKREVAQLAAQAEKNAQAPDIQSYIHSLQLSNGIMSASPAVALSLVSQGQVMIFVSSSMSLTSLTQWFNQAQRIKAPLILRGFVNNSLPDTKKWVQQLLEQANKKGGIQINPVVYENYNITQVPAVVVTSETINCPSNQSCMTPPYDVVYGNVSLDEALKVIAEKGDSANVFAKQMLQQLETTMRMQ